MLKELILNKKTNNKKWKIFRHLTKKTQGYKEAYEKMVSILSHEGKAHLNHQLSLRTN